MSCRCGNHIQVKDTIYETLQYIDGKKTTCLQCFLGNPQSYATRTVSTEDATKSREYLERMDGKMYVHSPYVINLASNDDSIVEKGRNSLQKIINTLNQISPQRTGVVYHFGAKGTVENVGRQINDMNITVPTFVENSAGEGTKLGKNFEELRHLIEATDSFNHGVCIDTCHSFASGMTDFRDISQTEKLFEDLSTFEDRPIMFHVNDSLTEFNGRKDRHAPIRNGHLFNLNRPDSEAPLIRLYELAKSSGTDIIFETANLVSSEYEVELFHKS